MNSNPEVVSIGNLNMDLIGKLKNIPRSDEKTLLDEFERWPGGGGANFAAMCEKLNLDTGFVGCVGNDHFGKKILNDLKDRGVDISHVRNVNASTGFAFIFQTPSGKRLLIEHRGANSRLKPSDLKYGYLDHAKLLHASSVNPKIAEEVGNKADEIGAKSSLDLGAELTQLEGKKLIEVLRHFDICFMNGETFEGIFEMSPTEKNISNQLSSVLDISVVTLGPEGAIASSEKETISSPTFDVDVKDTTGAGDTFAAVFDKYILEGKSIGEAVRRATAAAAMKVQHVGGREGLPNQKEIKKFSISNLDNRK